MPASIQPPNPTAFVTQQAEELLRLIKNVSDEVAVELVTLHLRLAYQQGVKDGLVTKVSRL